MITAFIIVVVLAAVAMMLVSPIVITRFMYAGL